jgi:hypothetical protein
VALPPPRNPADPQASQDASGRPRRSGDELADACAALEAEVEELKVKYEMYFLGVELREPSRWREDVRKKVLRIKETFTRNTGLRFRLQSLHARFISYERLWLRSAREREEGTYRRDLFKARLHARGKAPMGPGARRPAPVAIPGHEGEDVDLSDFHDEPAAPPAARPAAVPAPVARVAEPVAGGVKGPGAAPRPAARPAAPAASPAATGRLADAQMRELYDAFVTAKKRCNEDTSKLTYDAVASSVAKQIPQIMKQHQARSVEFKVVIKDGKAKLTAVPKS